MDSIFYLLFYTDWLRTLGRGSSHFLRSYGHLHPSFTFITGQSWRLSDKCQLFQYLISRLQVLGALKHFLCKPSPLISFSRTFSHAPHPSPTSISIPLWVLTPVTQFVYCELPHLNLRCAMYIIAHLNYLHSAPYNARFTPLGPVTFLSRYSHGDIYSFSATAV